jgi:glycosyltransferase involved in cell wall biosynthesis
MHHVTTPESMTVAILPLISIVVIAGDDPAALARTLASIQAQTFTDYEIIEATTREAGMKRTKGNRVFFLDAGEVWQPSALAARLAEVGRAHYRRKLVSH